MAQAKQVDDPSMMDWLRSELGIGPAMAQPGPGQPSQVQVFPSSQDQPAQNAIEVPTTEEPDLAAAPPTVTPKQSAARAMGAATPTISALQDALNSLDSGEVDALKQQGLTADALKKKLQGLEGQGPQANYMPLMALADAWTGSNFAKNYENPEANRQAMIAKLQDQLDQTQQGLSKDQVEYLKNRLSNEQHKQELSEREKDRAAMMDYRNAALGNRSGKTDASNFIGASKDLQKDAAYTDELKKFGEINDVKNQIASAQTNPFSYNTLPMALVRLFVNRVSQQELSQAGGEKDLMGRAAQFGQQMKSGTLTSANAAFMNDLAKTMEQSSAKNLKGHIERHANNYLAIPGVDAGQDVGKVADQLSGGLYSKVNKFSPESQTDAAKQWLKDDKNKTDPLYQKVYQQVYGSGG